MWEGDEMAKGKQSAEKKRRILIGINASTSSKIASNYMKDFLGGGDRDFDVVLLHVVPRAKSEEDKKLRGINEEEELSKIKDILQEIKNDFVSSGLEPDAVKIEIDKGKHDTVAEGILDHLKEGDLWTVVLGRRGISKAEEFLFGSVTQRVVSEAKGCAILVVEPESTGGENA
jgi:nucleotide-binding universal stress UspA family protein